MNFGKIRSETPVTRISPTMTKGFNGSWMMDVISGFGKKIWKHPQNSLKPMGHGKNLKKLDIHQEKIIENLAKKGVPIFPEVMVSSWFPLSGRSFD